MTMKTDFFFFARKNTKRQFEATIKKEICLCSLQSMLLEVFMYVTEREKQHTQSVSVC